MTEAVAYKAALLEAAARYVAQSWHLFVCGSDKRPLHQGGFKNASTDLSRLDRVLTRHADGMLAVRTGSESGIVVIDVDVDTAKGIDGRGWLTEARGKGLPDCPIAGNPRVEDSISISRTRVARSKVRPVGSAKASTSEEMVAMLLLLRHDHRRGLIGGGRLQAPSRRRCPNGYWRRSPSRRRVSRSIISCVRRDPTGTTCTTPPRTAVEMAERMISVTRRTTPKEPVQLVQLVHVADTHARTDSHRLTTVMRSWCERWCSVVQGPSFGPLGGAASAVQTWPTPGFAGFSSIGWSPQPVAVGAARYSSRSYVETACWRRGSLWLPPGFQASGSSGFRRPL